MKNTPGAVQEELATKVKRLLAESLGVEVEDISEDDYFVEDLHMAPAQLSDFVDLLGNQGFETSRLEIAELENVQELIEALSSHEELK